MQLEIDMDGIIRRFSDHERYNFIKGLLETIKEDGTITHIRGLVNSPKYDEQPWPAPEKEAGVI